MLLLYFVLPLSLLVTHPSVSRFPLALFLFSFSHSPRFRIHALSPIAQSVTPSPPLLLHDKVHILQPIWSKILLPFAPYFLQLVYVQLMYAIDLLWRRLGILFNLNRPADDNVDRLAPWKQAKIIIKGATSMEERESEAGNLFEERLKLEELRIGPVLQLLVYV